MPSGYTAPIIDKDISFEDFVLTCARAFGALIEMRDDPLSKEIPDKFQPNDFYKNKFDENYEELGWLLSLTTEEAQKQADKEYQEEIEHRDASIKKKEKEREKYEAMLEKVKAWEPPTEDHVELKNFMIQQIEDSIKFDCNLDFYNDWPIKKKTGSEWLSDRINSTSKIIGRYKEEYEKEVQRAKGRTAWVQALKNSLK